MQTRRKKYITKQVLKSHKHKTLKNASNQIINFQEKLTKAMRDESLHSESESDTEVAHTKKKRKIDNKGPSSLEQVLSDKLPVDDLCVNGENIRSSIDNWCKSAKYVVEIHKQDLLRYHIIDTIESSASDARIIFENKWDELISVMEDILTYNDPDNIEKQDVKVYLKDLMKKMTWKQLDVAVKAEKKKLRTSDKWKQKALKLTKIFKDQFENDRNMLTKAQTEYNYIINFISRLFKLMFKNDDEIELDWGEKTLKASAILKNQSLRDDYRRSYGNKIDLVLSIKEILLEISIMEVSGAPCESDHSHYVGDRNKIAKMLNIVINNIVTNYPGDFEMLRKIKFFGIQIYDHTFYVYSMSMPFPATYYYKLEYKFTCPKTIRTLHRELPKFGYNLWKMRDLVKSSVSDIMSYIDNGDSEASDVSLDPIKQSPKKTRARKS